MDMGRRFRDFCTDESAVSSIEYALIAAGVAVVTLAAIKPARAPPRCPTCGLPMEFMTTITSFELHPELRVFGCKKCGKTELEEWPRPNLPGSFFWLARLDHMRRAARKLIGPLTAALKVCLAIVHHFKQALRRDGTRTVSVLGSHLIRKMANNLIGQFSAVSLDQFSYVRVRMFRQYWSPLVSMKALYRLTECVLVRWLARKEP
jgi:hypothetical protein